MDIGAELSLRVKEAIKAKLKEMDCYVDDELPDYVLVMLANKKPKDNIVEDLKLFLGSKAAPFTEWIHNLLNRLQNLDNSETASTAATPVSRDSGQTATSWKQPTQNNYSKNVTSFTHHYQTQRKDSENNTGSSRYTPRRERNKQRSATPPELLDLKLGQNEFDEFEKEGIEEDTMEVDDRRSRSPLNSRRERSYHRYHRSEEEELDMERDAFSGQRHERRIESVIQVPRRTRGGEQGMKSINKTLMQDVDGLKRNARRAIDDVTNSRRGVATESTRIHDRLGSREPSPNVRDASSNDRVTVIRHLDRDTDRRVVEVESSSRPPRFIVEDDEFGDEDEDDSLHFVEDDPSYIPDSNSPVSSSMNRECSWANQCAGPPRPDDSIITAKRKMRVLDLTRRFKKLRGKELKVVSSPAEEGLVLPSATVTNAELPPGGIPQRCQYWPACRDGDQCPYIHPNQLCRAFPKCPFGAKCYYIHPNCRYDHSCQLKGCPFTHSRPQASGFPIKFKSAAPIGFRSTRSNPYPRTVATPAHMKYVAPELQRQQLQCENTGPRRTGTDVSGATSWTNATPWAPTKNLRPCRNGNNCPGLRSGSCRFFHPTNDKKWVSEEFKAERRALHETATNSIDDTIASASGETKSEAANI